MLSVFSSSFFVLGVLLLPSSPLVMKFSSIDTERSSGYLLVTFNCFIFREFSLFSCFGLEVFSFLLSYLVCL